MENKKDKYIKLWRDDIRGNPISWRAQVLYGFINSLTKKKGYCFATNKFLADEMGVCRKTISRALKELRTAGLIVSKYMRDENGNRIRVICPSLTPKRSYNTGQGSPITTDTSVPHDIDRDINNDTTLGGQYSDWD